MMRTAVHSNALDSSVRLFAMVCLIWGLTWIPIKVGVAWVPPMLFAAARGLAAGALLLGLHWRRSGHPIVARRHVLRLGTAAFLVYAAGYALLFWGAARVDSGVAAVANLSLMPLLLLVLAVAMREERLSSLKIVSTLLGTAGMALLFSTDLRDADELRGRGIWAIVLSTVSFTLGTVVSRKLLRSYSPVLVSGWVLTVGATMLFVASVLLEADSPAALAHLGRPSVFFSWTYLVIFGSVIAFTGYLRLTHQWSPARAGFYAFVSPAIAVAAGILVLDELPRPKELLGILMMLTSTVLVLRARRGRNRAKERRDDSSWQGRSLEER
jgi:drug/metabolite transporter (DMT)-like permease